MKGNDLKVFHNPHAGKVIALSSGRRIHGVSHSWATAVDIALDGILDVSPDLRHVMIRVPKAENDVLRLFHSDDGQNWTQVHLPDYFGTKRGDIRSIVRGAQEIDGDKAFPTELNALNLRLREQAGLIVEPRSSQRFSAIKVHHFDSISDWVETKARAIRDFAADLYVNGATSEEHRKGREMSLVAIERTIDRLRLDLRFDSSFEIDEADTRYDVQLEGAIRDHFVRRRYPFVTSTYDFRKALPKLPKKDQLKVARGFWADAAGLPRDARFDHIYGKLLSAAKGHPIYGDQDYYRLEALLADAVRNGDHMVRIGDRLFVNSGNRWRAMREDGAKAGVADWARGNIISRNFGRLIVPPHSRDGLLVPGYTRNGPGEGPSGLRNPALTMRCVERPINQSDLVWLHAFHAWESAQK